MANFDYILMDVDGTLFDFIEAEKYSLKGVVEKFGGKYSPEMQRIYHENNEKFWRALENGEMTRETLQKIRFREFFALVGMQGDPIRANSMYLDNLSQCVFPLEGAEMVCRSLASRCELAIVTNGITRAQMSRLKRCGFADCFSKVYISEQVGSQKPQKAFFDAVLQDTPYARERILIVGDSLSSDMRGGMNAGIQTCWIRPNGTQNPDAIRCDFEIQRLPELLEIVG